MTYHINWILVNKLLVYKKISFIRKCFSCSTIWTISVDIKSGPYSEWVRRVWSHPPTCSWANDFKIMQFFFFTRNCVYIPNFGLKIGIFLRFAPHFVIKIPEFCTPFSKSLRTGLKVSIKHKVSLSHTHKHVIFPFFKTSRKLSDIMECFLDHECQDLVRPSLTRPNLKWRSYTWLGGSTYNQICEIAYYLLYFSQWITFNYMPIT